MRDEHGKIIPPVGLVSLSDKLKPVCENPTPYSPSYAFTRGIVDVSAFKCKLRNLPKETWEDSFQQETNVKLTRPAHDAWGIKKIVFNFCDDFLLKVLDLPWGRNEEWRSLLLPIYEAIGINENQVVRSLLANMPPGLNIPVHHDTGYWVKHCHRCHVAIETGDDVDFLIGPTNELMEKYLFDEGRIVELNNQAKHAVTNNMTRPRIHLIFDYVETDFTIQRHLLQPGELVYQTRRSLDLASDFGSQKCPNYIIIGAQKCGTTSLYEYISQHGLALKGMRRETHFFDWRWPWQKGEPEASNAKAYECYLKFYPHQAIMKHPSLFTGESTPSYLLHSDIVLSRIKATVPWVRILVMLRDPTARAYSHYQMCADQSGTEEQKKVRGMSAYIGRTFEQIICEEIKELETLGINPSTSYETFKSKYLSSRPLGHGGHSLVARGLYCLQLLPWLEGFSADKQVLVLDLSDIKGQKEHVQSTMNSVFKFLGVPPQDVEDTAPKNSRVYEPISPEVESILKAFYEPYNMRLYELIGRQLGW